MKAIFIGAKAAERAFGAPSICGAYIVVDWTSDEPMVEYSCLMAHRLHAYQYNLGKPGWACCCGPS